MIWSVSTSARSSTEMGPDTTRIGSMSVTPADRPDCGLTGSTGPRPAGIVPDVDGVALDRRRGAHLGRDEVGAPAAALAALEVAVGCRGAALARLEDVRVHPQAHRAARRAPVEPGGAEHVVEPLGLGLRGHGLGAGDDH